MTVVQMKAVSRFGELTEIKYGGGLYKKNNAKERMQEHQCEMISVEWSIPVFFQDCELCAEWIFMGFCPYVSLAVCQRYENRPYS